jgi:Single-strand binding protein family
MYQNKVTLIGFLGSDAEVRTANNRSFTTLSIATKSSYKDKKSGEYVSHTEWHRCVVFGKLTEFAATLSKGAHVQVTWAEPTEPEGGGSSLSAAALRPPPPTSAGLFEAVTKLYARTQLIAGATSGLPTIQALFKTGRVSRLVSHVADP